jgi:glyoxylase-like metal-dependent hydrolase (beta-lactamase superfamily II)
MNVHVLRIPFSFGGKEDALYPVLLEGANQLVLVDCGYAGFLPLIEEEARRKGFSLEKLTGLILTHHDMDHTGGAGELKEKYPHVRVYCSAAEADYISGKTKSLRLQQAEAIYPSLPEDQKPGARQFAQMLRQVQPVEVDYTFGEDEEPPFFEGIRIISTPGHMPGHISLYHKEQKLLIAADALVAEGGGLEIANPAFTLDLAQAVASVRKLQQPDSAAIVCYHGGVVEEDIPGKLNRLITRYS